VNIEDLQLEENESAVKEAKQLFSSNEPATRTELEERDIKIIMKLLFYERLTKTGLIEKLVNDFLVLRISKNRQSRKEFVEALRNSLVQESRINSLEKFVGGR
jgi:hypothetical protein